MSQPHFESLYHIKEIAQLSPFNYILDKRKSSKGWIVLKGPQGDKLLVRNTQSPGQSFFKNADFADDKGKLLKFVSSRLTGTKTTALSDNDINEGVSWLHNFHGSDYKTELKTIQERNEKLSKKKVDLEEAYKNPHNIIPLKDHNYLTNHRHLTSETITDPLFKGTIFNTLVKMDNGHTFYNTAFAGIDHNNEIKGLEVRGPNFKSIGLDYAALWHSKPQDPSKPIDAVFYSESALDALAYYQIFKDRLNESFNNFIFISTKGSLDSRKKSNILEILDRYNSNKNITTVAIFDNDIKGSIYNLELIELLCDKNEDTFSLSLTEEYFDVITFKETPSTEQLNLFRSFAQEYNDNVKVETDSSYGQYVITKVIDNIYKLFLPKPLKHAAKASKELVKVLSEGKTEYYVHKPKTDWNDHIIPNKKKPENEVTLRKTSIKR